MTATTTDRLVRHRIRVRGVVQGVGFRPFALGLATELELSGHVGNDTEGVFIEVEGNIGRVESFESRLVGEAPPLARIWSLEASAVDVLGGACFKVVESQAGRGGASTFVSPDVGTCQACLSEISDPTDRRYRYPFTNCTNCGPRFTITIRLPYDRPNTTMEKFDLCAGCAHEYRDPTDRRFHAQPIACPECGPRLWFEPLDGGGPIEGTDRALAATQAALDRGEIVAIKGLGGYHLACDATSDVAVEKLRRRKQRPHKPLAVMVRDLSVAGQIAEVDQYERGVLESSSRPIVLLRQRADATISAAVAPGNPNVGVMLPYTPLHHLLFRPVPGADQLAPRVVVMTSGNLSDEPICYEDVDARHRLSQIVDSWLVHDRPIHVPCDDSVIKVDAGFELPIRRSRGYAPLPVRLPFSLPPVLATGGELKNTFCLAAGRNAWVSQHIGDMGTVETLGAFEHSARQFADLYDVTPEVLVTDSHPGYQTRRWAEEHAPRQSDGTARDVELVQHHHAHVAAVMAEHGVPPGERVIGVAFDGTGYGTDGAIWGGEILIAGYGDFERVAHLGYVPLPGADAAVTKPYRVALAHLRSAGIEWSHDLPPVAAAPPPELGALERQLERQFHCVPTSSMGRLFDAVSSLVGIRHVASYEAQAAIELEAAAGSAKTGPNPYRFAVTDGGFDAAPVLRAIVDDLRSARPVTDIAAGFHSAVATMVAEQAERLRAATGVNRVVLSGGVFQNVLLVRMVRSELAWRGLAVLTHRAVPPNDGGLALGQAVVGGFRHGPRKQHDQVKR
jgi:hydrogenase maturation protein HypF